MRSRIILLALSIAGITLCGCATDPNSVYRYGGYGPIDGPYRSVRPAYDDRYAHSVSRPRDLRMSPQQQQAEQCRPYERFICKDEYRCTCYRDPPVGYSF